MAIKPSYLLLTGAGAVVAWSGLKGKGISSAVREVISGKNPALAKTVNQSKAAVYAAYGYGANVTTVAQATGATPGQTAPNNARAKKNIAIARVQATYYGWGSGNQWAALVKLWTQESAWNNYADNPTSDAEGIAQALPYTKMPQLGWLPRHGGPASATVQIAWGLNYIQGQYGNPVNAWAHEVANGWY